MQVIKETDLAIQVQVKKRLNFIKTGGIEKDSLIFERIISLLESYKDSIRPIEIYARLELGFGYTKEEAQRKIKMAKQDLEYTIPELVEAVKIWYETKKTEHFKHLIIDIGETEVWIPKCILNKQSQVKVLAYKNLNRENKLGRIHLIEGRMIKQGVAGLAITNAYELIF